MIIIKFFFFFSKYTWDLSSHPHVYKHTRGSSLDLSTRVIWPDDSRYCQAERPKGIHPVAKLFPNFSRFVAFFFVYFFIIIISLSSVLDSLFYFIFLLRFAFHTHRCFLFLLQLHARSMKALKKNKTKIKKKKKHDRPPVASGIARLLLIVFFQFQTHQVFTLFTGGLVVARKITSPSGFFYFLSVVFFRRQANKLSRYFFTFIYFFLFSLLQFCFRIAAVVKFQGDMHLNLWFATASTMSFICLYLQNLSKLFSFLCLPLPLFHPLSMYTAIPHRDILRI